MEPMNRQPNADKLLRIAGVTMPLIGFYDVPDITPFQPFAKPKHCIFSCFTNWVSGESTVVTEEHFSCMGAGYWLCGVESRSREDMVEFLANKEGLRSSPEIMSQWLDNQKPYKKEHPYIVIGPLKDDQYAYLKTVTFIVTPDQLSLLMMGAEYHNPSSDNQQVMVKFGSGCSQLSALFDDLTIPKAIIGATDIAMREHVPSSMLALTVTKGMFEQMCALDDKSFLHKPFWKQLRKAREKHLDT